MPNLDSDDSKLVKEQSLKRYYRDELGRPDWEQRVRKREFYVGCFMKQIRRQVKLQGRSILDVGSGWGDLLCSASRYAALCVGVEPDIERIAISKTFLRQSKQDAYLVRAVGEYLPFRCGTFDFTSCMSVLEHVNDPVSVLKEIVRVTKSGGMGYISFPNYMFPLEPHYNLVWLPFMPRGLAHKYLRIWGRNPRFIDSINYVTPFLVERTLRRLGTKIRNLLLDGSLKNDNFPNRSALKQVMLSIMGKIGNNIVGRSLAYFSPSWAIMFFKPNPSELRQTESLKRRGEQKVGPLLFLYHLLQLAITSSVAKRHAQNIELIVCITIDGDEKNKGDIATAVPLLLRFFDQTHLRGKVTWFLNQHDVNWVERYPDLIKQILDRKDEVGLHSHVEDRIYDYRSLVRIISDAKQKIEEYCAKRLSNNHSIISFRSGKLAKSEELFNAISDAGFKFDSSVRPGWSRNDIHTDDRDVPPLIGPYYVDPIDYKVPSPSPKTILELPVTLDPYSPLDRKDPNQQKRLYVILKHPYSFLGILGLFTRAHIRALLFCFKRFPKVKFMTIKDAGQHFIENQHRQR